MQSPEISELIKRAAANVGNKAALARHMGVNQSRLREWETGVRTCPIEDVAILADVAGLPAEIWLARAAMWTHEGTPKGERLKKALGKYARAIGAVLALCLALVAGHHASDREPVFFPR